MNILSAKNKSTKWLMLGIFFYIAVLFAICCIKYFYYQYSAFDLAIFNQTFYNTSFGDIFAMTIHPPSYLGDHFVPLIILLTPLYTLWRSPLNLLLWQTIILSLTTIPFYLIGKKLLNRKALLVLTLALLLNPFIINTNLFEFHILSFLPFLFLFTFYFYQQKKFKPFLLLFVLSLLIREDVALIMSIFGILALIEKRSIKWIIAPIFLSSFYFLGAILLINLMAPASNYKFMIYYSWLGDSPGNILKNIIFHPWLVVMHIATFKNLFMVIGFIMGFLFLPLLKPKYLLFCLPPFLQIILGIPGGSTLMLTTHYSALFIPGLALATIYGLKTLTSRSKHPEKRASKLLAAKIFFAKEEKLSLSIFIACIIYISIALGPFYQGYKDIVNNFDHDERVVRDYLVEQIPKEAPLAATASFLTNLSSRKNIAAMRYALIGKKQFGQGDYQLPDNTQYLLFDSIDSTANNLTFKNYSIFSDYYPKAASQFKNQLTSLNFHPIITIDRFSLWQKNAKPNYPPYQTNPIDETPGQLNGEKISLNQEILFHGYTTASQLTLPIKMEQKKFLPISLYWQALTSITNNYYLQLEVVDQAGSSLYSQLYPIAGGIYPTADWLTDEIIIDNHAFLLPLPDDDQTTRLQLSLVDISGGVELNGLRNSILKIDKINQLGPKINIDNYQALMAGK